MNGSRVGSWILEEPVHFFDMLMWWFEELGDPHLVHGFGNAKSGREAGMYDNFSAVMRWPKGAYAVVTQTLAGFEHHHVVEVVGQRRVDPGLVVGRHGPHGRSPPRAEGPAARPQPE